MTPVQVIYRLIRLLYESIIYFSDAFFNVKKYPRRNRTLKVGVAQFNLSLKQVAEIKISKVDLLTQSQIISLIEKEQALVNANKELIQIFEQKIKDRIAKVWGTTVAPTSTSEEENLTMAAEPEIEYYEV